MIYKQCIDDCFDCVKACCWFLSGACESTKKDCEAIETVTLCTEVCNLVGKCTASGICRKELFEICIKICDECYESCSKMEGEKAKKCAEACKKCSESCRKCAEDCKKQGKVF